MILVGVHVALDVTLTSRSWFWSQPVLMVALAIPLSQLGLLAIWAAVVSSNPLLRFGLPILGIAACWFLMSRILPWGTGEAASAGWAIALVVQVLTVLVAVECFRLIRNHRPVEEKILEGTTNVSQIRFGMSTLMLWITSVAIGLGFLQFGQHYWQWTAGIFQWKLLWAMPIIGITNGLVAVLWLWALACGEQTTRGAKNATSAVATGGLAFLCSYSSTWVTGTSVLKLDDSFIVLIAQSLMISLSLVIAKSHYQAPATGTP